MSFIESKHQINRKNRDYHRVIESLKTELEAIDCYNQRIDACDDAELESIFRFIGDRHKKNVSQLLDWMSENDEVFHNELINNVAFFPTTSKRVSSEKDKYSDELKGIKKQRRQMLLHFNSPKSKKKKGKSISDQEGHYDIDGVSYDEGEVYLGSN